MKNLILFKLLLLLIINSCSGISQFAPKKGATGEEFLIQKKNPLVLPPDYNNLPVPSTEKVKDGNNSEKVISLLGIDTDSKTSKENEEDETLENSILKKIKNN
ncbi:MAG: DUF3035 domain-containing protein [Candidatus Pelagibacter sp.]|tara:strand:- start:1 stop:309 length:309 start_codon:yes stop_codon:yes gene_type:complete